MATEVVIRKVASCFILDRTIIRFLNNTFRGYIFASGLVEYIAGLMNYSQGKAAKISIYSTVL